LRKSQLIKVRRNKDLEISDMQMINFRISQLAVIMIFTGCSDNNAQEILVNGKENPDIPHVSFVSMNEFQPQEKDPDVIWYDDFDDEKIYLESSGAIDHTEFFGTKGGSMIAGFKKSEVSGAGNRKVAFGDFPGASRVIARGKRFEEIYWRIYIKHEYGWEGAPAKMSRATSIVSEKWQQAMIVHVWSGDKNSLTLDPATGVKGQTDSIQTNKYNDFANLRWLGNKPSSEFQISSTGESGYWVLVEAFAKLNTPGLSNGSCRLWIDGRLEAERTNLNFVGSYTKHGINAVFLESYWNSGAVKTEGRWFDNFVVSTKPVGPVTTSLFPVLYRTTYHGPGEIEAWRVEIATDNTGTDVVYRSDNMGKEDKIVINPEMGNFAGTLGGSIYLMPGPIYFCRICQKSTNGQWSQWSRWHQPFKVAAD
jgi:hypothetical protein